MFDTIISRDNPNAASQAVKTGKIMGIMLARVKWVFRIIRVAIINNDIIPFRNSREDIIFAPGEYDLYSAKQTHLPRAELLNHQAVAKR